MDKDYKQYIESLNLKQNTSLELIREVVKSEIGKELISTQRIVSGEVNEVYDILLSNRVHIILRISVNNKPEFQQEQWAMQKVKVIGIPVPEILLIKYLTLNGDKFSFCFMNKIKGNLLDRGTINFSELALDEQKDYVYEAGNILSRIHSIPTSGFGKISDSGKTEYPNANRLFDKWLSKRYLYESVAKEVNLDLSIIKTAFEASVLLKPKLLTAKPCLNHGDYFLKHIMVVKNKVVAILDWGEIRSDSPVYDLANWDFWEGKQIPFKWLKDGYANKKVFENGFEDIFHFMKIEIGLEVLYWYHKQKFKERVEKTKAKLINEINYFR